MQRLAGELEIVLSSKSSIAGHEMQNKVLLERVQKLTSANEAQSGTIAALRRSEEVSAMGESRSVEEAAAYRLSIQHAVPFDGV